MPATPEQLELLPQVLKQHGIIRSLEPSFYTQAVKDAMPFHGCYLAYWVHDWTRYFIIYRLDRCPNDRETLPWMELLFVDGPIHELDKTAFMRSFMQGNVYVTKTVADSVGDAFADAADKDSNADAFDLDKTELGKQLIHKAENAD